MVEVCWGRSIMNRTMKFSWKTLILAPLPIPLVFSALLEILAPVRGSILSFLFFFVLGSVLSYGITIFFSCPACFWYQNSLIWRFAWRVSSELCLGASCTSPVSWEFYLASGVDSGPPQGTFGDYLRWHGFEWDFWVLLLAGLITALLYWYLVNQWSGRNDQSKARSREKDS